MHKGLGLLWTKTERNKHIECNDDITSSSVPKQYRAALYAASALKIRTTNYLSVIPSANFQVKIYYYM